MGIIVIFYFLLLGDILYFGTSRWHNVTRAKQLCTTWINPSITSIRSRIGKGCMVMSCYVNNLPLRDYFFNTNLLYLIFNHCIVLSQSDSLLYC